MESDLGGKCCKECGELKDIITCFYKNPHNADGYRDVCIECYKKRPSSTKKKPPNTTEEIIKQIEDGSFEVDQKWLLKELISQYKDPKCRDRLKALQMIMQVSGYNDQNTDDKSIMDSLLESMKNGSDKDQ